MIYVFCHNAIVKPSGGVKVLFKIAESIKTLGHEVKILIPGSLYPHENPSNYRPPWFNSPVEIVNDIGVLTSNDLIFIHEEAVWAFNELKAKGTPHVMINQGAQSTMCIPHVGYTEISQIYRTSLGVVCASDYIANAMKTFFSIPNSRIYRVNPVNIIDGCFLSNNHIKKKNKIFIQVKSTGVRNIANQLIIKTISGRYPGWEVEVLEEKSQEALARTMAESKIFVFLSGDCGEGLGLPPIEAAISGCKVIGYSGLGGRPYFMYPNFTEVEYNDVIEFISTVDHWTSELKDITILEYAPRAEFVHDTLLRQVDEGLFVRDVKEFMERLLHG